MSSSPPSEIECALDKPHGLLDELVGGLGEKGIMALAVDRFAADLKQHGHCQRRHRVERAMHDLTLDASEEGAQPMHIDEAVGGILPCRPEQEMPRLMLAQYIVDEI